MTDSKRPNEGPVDWMAVPYVTVDWYRSTPWWPLLSRSVVASWSTTHLILAGLAFLITGLGWNLAESLFGPESRSAILWTEPSLFQSPLRSSAVPGAEPTWREFSLRADSTEQIDLMGRITSRSPFFNVWLAYVQPALDFFGVFSARRWAYVLFGMLWTTAVWGLFGGVIARRAAVELGGGGRIGIVSSFKIAGQRLISTIWSIFSPFFAIFLFCLFPLFLGWLSRWGTAGSIIAGIGLVLFIPLMLVLGWWALLSILGFPISVVAIVTEKRSDAFEGLSRASAYIFQRPVTLAFSIFVAMILSLIVQAIVGFAFKLAQSFVMYGFEVGLGADLATLGGNDMNSVGYMLAWFVYQTIELIVLAAPFSFFWCAAAGIYLTLRWEVDNIDFDEYDPAVEATTQAAKKAKSIEPQQPVVADEQVAE